MVGCCLDPEVISEKEGAMDPRNGLVPKSQRKYDLNFFVVGCVLNLTAARFLHGQVSRWVLLRCVYSLLDRHDYNGNVCGDGDYVNARFTAYPRLNEDLLVAAANGVSPTNAKFFGVCVESCPSAGSKTCTYGGEMCWVVAQDTEPAFFRCLPVVSSNETVLEEVCIDLEGADPNCTVHRYEAGECNAICNTKRAHKEVWEVEATGGTSPLLSQLQGNLQVLGRFLNDMYAARSAVLLVGGLGALILGLLWLVVLQFFAGCVVWLTCSLVLIGLILLSLFCSVRSELISSEDVEALSFMNATSIDTTALAVTSDENTKLQFKSAAYVSWVVTVVVLLLIISMRKRLKVAIAIIRESSKAMQKLPMLLLWPIVPTAFFVGLVIYSVAIAAYLLSSDDLSSAVKEAGNVTSELRAAEELPAKRLQQVLLAFHVFGFLWTNQLLQAISICVIAGATAQFYWTPPSSNGKRKIEASFPIARALGYTLRFSLGSLCFGSFIIAFVQLLRIMLEYLDRNTKQIQQTNRVVRVVLLTVKCCLWCFEKCIKFLSKNAYILIAMKGSSFCTASARSFKLIFKNMARVAVVNSISFFLLFLIKMTVTLAVGLVVFALLSKSSSLSLSAEQLSLLGGATVTSPLAPAVVACVLAWLVASAFVNVYDTAIDTILLCFCEDTELHGETASEFMSKELQHIMGGSVPSIGDKNQLIHVSS
ncbi:Calponin homology domain-containing proteinoline transpo [Phytophthora infestans]|uniref:Choline transporter-like protein n=1 Tax=Phytophthora infestans TaxID=4787 RepID=A0A833TTJ4_PHYIN|nr:Calponin homology domain-containing proteinoline transpo [Phytophthora infestans]